MSEQLEADTAVEKATYAYEEAVEPGAPTTPAPPLDPPPPVPNPDEDEQTGIAPE